MSQEREFSKSESRILNTSRMFNPTFLFCFVFLTRFFIFCSSFFRTRHHLASSAAGNILANPWRNFSMFEMLLYNMRHVQHHSAQVNKFLRHHMGNTPAWEEITKDDLRFALL